MSVEGAPLNQSQKGSVLVEYVLLDVYNFTGLYFSGTVEFGRTIRSSETSGPKQNRYAGSDILHELYVMLKFCVVQKLSKFKHFETILVISPFDLQGESKTSLGVWRAVE